MRILGIDPGYATVGWGVIDYKNNRFSIVDYGAILTPPNIEFSSRLGQIYDDIIAISQRYKTEFMAVEKVFYNTNAKTVIDVSQARGVILLAAHKACMEISEYTPLQVKQSVVGYGRAEKKQVQEMTKVILKLESIPKPDDTADALALAICHAHTGGSMLCKLNRLKIKTGI